MKAISTKLYPILRSEGFRGSGNTLRRIDSPLVHVFNVQGSTRGERCYLNVGAHLTFLSEPGGGETDAKRLKEYECAFRDRIDPPAREALGWSYGTNLDEMQETIALICERWSTDGHQFFGRFAVFPDDFVTLVEEADESKIHPLELLTLARIAAHLKRNTRAEALAQEGLRRCPDRATGLRHYLNQLVRGLT